MALPTNAKMTALVCSGLIRPKVVYCEPIFSAGLKSCMAMSNPTVMPIIPHTMVAMAKFLTILLS
ncbi:hypothetical protein D3C86_1663680 [compost metagenome]